MRSLFFVAVAAVVSLFCRVGAAQPLHSDFVAETIHSGNSTITIEFGPTGEMFVIEKAGRVLRFAPNGSGGFATPTVFADIRSQVFTMGECGLLGLALDPAFATNRFVYLFFTTMSDERLVRVRANGALTAVESGSEMVLLSGLPRASVIHKGGHIAFNAADPGALYIGVGDDGVPARAQMQDRYEGKILRVSASNGQGLGDNPFFDGNANSVRSRIFAIGLRNPFRFAFHPALLRANALYLSENGDNRDRVALVRRGSNGNWGPSGDAGFLAPTDPNFRILANDARDTIGTSLIGIAIVRGGPFADPDNPNDDVMYVANGAGLPGMFASGVRRWRLTGTERDTATLVARDNNMHFARFMGHVNGAHMTFGPDGALYLSQAGGSDGQMRITRVRRVLGAAPRAMIATTPSPARGSAPLTVRFTDRSTDSDGTIRSRMWEFGDGMTSAETNPAHVYTTPGRFDVRLVVTDNVGQQGVATTTVEAVETVHVNLDVTIVDARTSAEMPLRAPTELRFYEMNGTQALNVSGSSNRIAVPAGGRLTTTLDFNLAGTAFVVSAGEPTEDGVHAVYRGFQLASGDNNVTLRFALSNVMIRGFVHTTTGERAVVDVGLARETPGSPYAVSGGRDYLPASSIPLTRINFRGVSDVLGYYAFPIRTADAPAMFFVDAVADTGAEQYLPHGFSESVAANGLLERNIEVGLVEGGAACEDLGEIAETPRVDYASQIEPIWGTCVGCHSDTASNNAGLNLMDDSYAALVGPTSVLVSGAALVIPGAPQRSFLFEKLRCENPQVGARMPPIETLSREEQALVRDWITQGARRTPDGPSPMPTQMPPGGGCAVGGEPASLSLLILSALALIVAFRTRQQN